MKFESGCPFCGDNRRNTEINNLFFDESSLLQQKLEDAERVIEEQDQVIHEQIKTIYDHIKKHGIQIE